jgi:glycosyltransferase involved in cell wall biosynthesis
MRMVQQRVASAPMNRPDLSVVMPVYNERETIERAIAGVLEADVAPTFELVVVDDGSTDGTSQILQQTTWPDNVRLLRHDRNRGKGAALRTGLAQADGRFSAIMDADLEYDPLDLKLLLEPLTAGRAEVVYGTRAFKSHSAYSFWYVVGNRGVTFAANLLYNSWISDIMTGHKAMSTELFRTLDLRERGFAIEAEITARLLARGVRIYEVPIDYVARGREQGKKLTAVDGLRVLRTLVRCRI